MQALEKHTMARRELGLRWTPSYAHLQPVGSADRPEHWERFAPAMQRWLQGDGYLLGPTMLSLQDFPPYYRDVEAIDGMLIDLACCQCTAQGDMFCHECLHLYCAACVDTPQPNLDCCEIGRAHV